MTPDPLKIGRRGPDVVELQRRLIAWGIGARPMIMDGDFGPLTEAAVMRFQAAHELEPDGFFGYVTLLELQNEIERHVVPWHKLPCLCGECGGFGLGRYENMYRSGKRRLEQEHMYEYLGIDSTVVWAVIGLMHRAQIDHIVVTSGYRCETMNRIKSRTSNGHKGKAVDFVPRFPWPYKMPDEEACELVRRVGREVCGFQAGWRRKNRVSFETAAYGAINWIHLDTRMIPRELRHHVATYNDLVAWPERFKMMSSPAE